MPFTLERTKQIEAGITELLESNRLNDWERSFLGNMKARFAQTGTKTRLSNAQYKKLHQLLKLEPENTGRTSPPKTVQSRSRIAPRRAIRRTERKLFWPIALVVGILGLLGAAFDTTPSSATATPQARSTPTVQADRTIYLFVTGDRVNQRAGPGTTSQVQGQLTKGSRVRQVSEQGGWTQIVSSLGNGWMSSSYLSLRRPVVTERPNPGPARQVAVPTSREIQAARRAIIRQSIASYPGSCPCPYNVDRGGRRCGGRSAWSRPGGYSPICYDSDINDSRLSSYFARQRQ
jgi:SH3-like domain-containing protein